MNKTSIEWTGFSVNPIRARWKDHNRFRSGHYCEKVSQGCLNCYSSEQQPRFGMPYFQHARGDENIEHYLEPKVLLQVLRATKPTQIFWCSMTDMFGRWVPNEWIAACFGVMAATPQHTHQVLTKRAARLPEWFGWISGLYGTGEMSGIHKIAPTVPVMGCQMRAAHYPELIGPLTAANQKPMPPWPLPNVHLGVSCETQQEADHRIPHLIRTPAAVRWISAEPLLGPIEYLPPSLDWVVVGGESGRRARPCQLEWMRAIVRRCKATDIPVLVKQLGRDPREGEQLVQLTSRKGGDINEFPIDLQIREYPR